MKPGGRKVPAGSINNAGTAAGWTKFNGKRHVEGDNPKNKEDGMKHYSANVGHIDVTFMCDNGKGFNVDRELKQFIPTARTIDKDFCLLPLEAKTTTCVSQQTYQTRRKVFKNTSVTDLRSTTSLGESRFKPN
jgi:hypothetical protein